MVFLSSGIGSPAPFCLEAPVRLVDCSRGSPLCSSRSVLNRSNCKLSVSIFCAIEFIRSLLLLSATPALPPMLPNWAIVG